MNNGKLCIGHAWYLMADMQLYFLSPFVLYPLWRIRNQTKLAIVFIFILASSSIIYSFVAMLQNDLRSSYLLAKNTMQYQSLIHISTLARIDSWMMGILAGFLLHKFDEKKIYIFPRKLVYSGWVYAIIAILLVIFIQYPLQQEYFEDIPQIFDALYIAFSRVIFGSAIVWIIIACKSSNGGIMNKFLSANYFLPLSRLSFCIYLVHLAIMLISIASVRTPEYFSTFRVFHQFLGYSGVSVVVAFFWSLTFEYPTLNLIAYLTKKNWKFM